MSDLTFAVYPVLEEENGDAVRPYGPALFNEPATPLDVDRSVVMDDDGYEVDQ